MNSAMKTTTIIVNGREKTVENKELTYDEILALAYDPVPAGDLICFTVTYRRGTGNKPEGELDEGENLKLKKGLIINVSYTDKS